jgi:tetratricopeptide (TPR) repeat protein
MYNNRAMAKNELKDFQGALADCNLAIKLNNKFLEAYINRSNSKIGLNDFQGAIDDCNKVILIDSSYSAAYNNRGSIYRNNLNDYKSAIKDFTKAIELTNEVAPDPIIFLNRAGAKYELEDFEGAIEDCDKALLIDVKLIGGYYVRGRVKLKLGQKESACLDFKKALDLGYIDTDGMVKQNCN